MKKVIAFIAPIWEWWPKTLYRDLVKSLDKNYPEYKYHLISSIKERILLHFINKKYDLIISSVPFLWKPPQCVYILHQHGLHKNDRGFSNPWRILARLYPYNTPFAKKIIYPSQFLLKYCGYKHKDQQVILNFSTFPIKEKTNSWLSNISKINLLTIFRADIRNKAIWILDLYEKLKIFKPSKKINYRIAWFWKYYEAMKRKFNISTLDKNITIEWIGWLDKIWVINEINKCDIFLYSTFYETFGIILLEVLSLWKPILLNNYPSYYWLYDDEFISKDDIDFISKLDKIISDREYYKSYLAKWKENLEKFNKELIVSEWYKTIKFQF